MILMFQWEGRISHRLGLIIAHNGIKGKQPSAIVSEVELIGIIGNSIVKCKTIENS